MIIQKRISFHFNTMNIIDKMQNKILYVAYLVSQKAQTIKIAGKMFTLIAFMTLIPVGINSTTQASYKTNIRFNPNSPSILANGQIIKSELGESEFNKAEREKKEAEAKTQVVVATTQNTTHSDPSDFDPIYKAAAARFGIDWRFLKAVHYVETGCSGSTSKGSYAGARGPMQFMSGTWRAYGIDGNNDGVTDICDVTDAIYGAANLLAQGGAAEGNIDAALLNYNHAQWYVNKVKEVAYSIN
jgi:hypothetical protein